MALAEYLPHDVPLDYVFETVPQASFDILATHRNDDAAGLGHESVCTDASLHQDGILTEAVHLSKLMVFLFDEDSTLLDDVERVGIIALVENDLSLFIGLSEASGGKCVLLLFC